jgi:putative transposase
MPRRPRSHLPEDGFFHVTSRGVARSEIFRDADDYRFFYALLVHVSRQFAWRCHVFCLMPNHVHLVLETSRAGLSRGMQRLSGRYAANFNSRHDRVGHLFQNRFDARAIERDAHFESACRYVLENAARAGLCRYDERWPWAGTLVEPEPDPEPAEAR